MNASYIRIQSSTRLKSEENSGISFGVARIEGGYQKLPMISNRVMDLDPDHQGALIHWEEKI
ncbi:hypothetical protein ACFQ3J_06380 [Paenibacillus provencensis]|uniref:Uncharacterized protein n=1 Tax=Paenibacillus provencensis TaxID=441151 RepID=A0ABW3PV82_9BACL|nr:hypothetical protein [Paenibacillus sp. MER 78]